MDIVKYNPELGLIIKAEPTWGMQVNATIIRRNPYARANNRVTVIPYPDSNNAYHVNIKNIHFGKTYTSIQVSIAGLFETGREAGRIISQLIKIGK